MFGVGNLLGVGKFKKVLSIVLAVLVLALGVLILREHVWPPAQALAGTSTLTPLSGDDITLNDDDVTETVAIVEGDVIKTGDDSYALVTFEDGSTVELEPNTEIEITTLTDDSISVMQNVGRTWSGVQKLASGPINDFEVNTPSAGAVVQGTLIETVVELSQSIIAAFEGTVEVTAEDITQIIMAGLQTIIENGQAPQAPSLIPLPKNTLEITVDGPAWALAVDPQDRSVGVVPPGIAITQIPRASTTGAQSTIQSIVVPVTETAGAQTYSIVLYGNDEGGSVDVTVKGYTEGVEEFSDTGSKVVLPYEKDGDEETKYVATLDVTVDANGDISSGDMGSFSLKATPGPGQVEIKDWASVRTDEAEAPHANFSASNMDDSVHFTNLSTGDIETYAWSFGDGDTSTDMSPTHEYDEGEYVVSLTVTGPAGEDTMIRTFYIIVI